MKADRRCILQYRTLMELIHGNRDTEYGKAHGFSDIHTLAGLQVLGPDLHL